MMKSASQRGAASGNVARRVRPDFIFTIDNLMGLLDGENLKLARDNWSELQQAYRQLTEPKFARHLLGKEFGMRCPDFYVNGEFADANMKRGLMEPFTVDADKINDEDIVLKAQAAAGALKSNFASSKKLTITQEQAQSLLALFTQEFRGAVGILFGHIFPDGGPMMQDKNLEYKTEASSKIISIECRGNSLSVTFTYYDRYWMHFNNERMVFSGVSWTQTLDIDSQGNVKPGLVKVEAQDIYVRALCQEWQQKISARTSASSSPAQQPGGETPVKPISPLRSMGQFGPSDTEHRYVSFVELDPDLRRCSY